ncbi:MAG: gamma-glutamylcyclotransferase [Candidatus Devosia phytovorans]|uniref:Putative gamma-glutamylcyclotransferase n=1 Tax=Candidatus Devosia phytovorans TaxID=3121372 RepID=A0AAJ5VT73_9HYPH|nr:gamma-glutamylcyclotransferase family protein [Devosia sp.]WEK04349.1 MAG: gamma-glutamylcyclotransferase [Devosia sp.]
MTQKPLFVYGTLQDADILGAVLGRSIDVRSLRTATAPLYSAVIFPDRVYPALVSTPGQHAAGLLLESLRPADLEALDAFEGDEYRRGTLDVLVDGTTIAAEAYFPVITISSDQPAWTLADWTAHHKPSVLDGEIETALALRERLTAPRRTP